MLRKLLKLIFIFISLHSGRLIASLPNIQYLEKRKERTESEGKLAGKL